MNLHPMKLVTIICESVLEERVVNLVIECGAHGHTAFPVRGSGSQGERHADIAETGNVQIEVILRETAAQTLIQRLHDQLFKHFAMVVRESDVRVLRADKF